MKLSISIFVTVLFCLKAYANSEENLFSKIHSKYQTNPGNILFYYATLSDRLDMLSDFFQQVELIYAPLKIKEKRIGLDLEKIKQEAYKAEAENPDVTDQLAKAEANLAFFDRLAITVAKFKDTHFYLKPIIKRTPVVNAVEIGFSKGKYFISSRRLKLIAYENQFGSGDFSKIELGDEVVEIDGKNPDEARKNLEPYISGSSQRAIEADAVSALTMRSFALPSRPYLQLKIRHSDGEVRDYKLIWAYRAGDRADQAMVMRARNIEDQQIFRLKWNAEKESWDESGLGTDNIDSTITISSLLDGKNFVSADEESIIKSGIIVSDQKAYAYLQVNSFHEAEVAQEGSTEMKKFEPSLSKEMKRLKNFGLPLILDLRNNGGGSPSRVVKLMSLLARKGELYANTTDMYSINRFNLTSLDYLDEYNQKQMSMEAPYLGLSKEEILEKIQTAYLEGKSYSPAFSACAITPDKELGGFEQSIVALIGPNCVSACDMMASILKHSKRATLLGTPSNGTGAGYGAVGDLTNNFTDRYKIITSKIPNDLFGQPIGAPTDFLSEDSDQDLNLENRPTLPDVEYLETMEDVISGNQGWIEAAVRVLELKR